MFHVLFHISKVDLQRGGVSSLGLLVCNQCAPFQLQCVNLCVNRPQEILVSVVICLNFVTIIMEANYGAECNGDMISRTGLLVSLCIQ